MIRVMKFRGFVVIVVAWGMWAGTCSAQTRPAMTLPTDPAMLKQYRDNTQYTLKMKLSPDHHRLADLVELTAEKGVIQVRSKASSGNTQMRVELDDLPGVTSLYANKAARGGHCQISNVYPIAAGFTVTNISGSSGNVHISVAENTTLGNANWQLSQNPSVVGGSPGINFSVFRNDRKGTASAQKQYYGSDLEDLRRRNPAAEDELRSLLSRVGQEHLLAADAQTAWQVFAGDVEPTPQVVQQVAALVKQLDADDFRARDDAVAKLRALGAPGMLAMMRTERRALSLEQQLRLDSALEPYKLLAEPAAKARRDDTMFLMDCLMCEDAQIRALALARLKQLAGRELKFNVDAPMAERVQALGAIRTELRATKTPGK